MNHNSYIHFKNARLLGFLVTIVGCGFSISLCGIGLGIYCGAFLATHAFKMGPFNTSQNQLSKDYLRPIPNHMILGLLLTSLALSLFMSDYFAISLKGYFKYLQGFILLYAGLDVIRNKKDFAIVSLVFVSVYAAASLDAIYQLFVGKDFLYGRLPDVYHEDRNLFRLTGAYKQATDFASFLAAGIPILVSMASYFLIRQKKILSLILVSICALSIFVLFQTASRGATISVMVAFLFLAIHFRFKWIFIGILIAAFVAMLFVPSVLSERIPHIFDLPKGTTPERLILIQTSIDMINTNPWFGLGLNTYSTYFPLFKPVDFGTLMYAHNGYLQIATEAGVVGLGLYVLYLFEVIRGVRKSALFKGDIRFVLLGIGLISGVIALLFNAMFESIFQSTQLRTLLWVILGMASGFALHDDSSDVGEGKASI